MSDPYSNSSQQLEVPRASPSRNTMGRTATSHGNAYTNEVQEI